MQKQATTSAATIHFRTHDTPMIGSTGTYTFFDTSCCVLFIG